MKRLSLVVWLFYPLLVQAADRPNFVFLFADDQRYDALSCVQQEQKEKGRFPWFQTPNMDRLAAEGIRFRQAFVVNALCSPSRACFLTGKYNHINGIVNNTTPLPTDAATHASLLKAAGYTTGYVGKWHMGQQSGKRPGFDWSASFTGQGRYQDAFFEIDGVRSTSKGWVDDVSGDFAVDFLEKNKDKPFLLIVGFKSPHGPFEGPVRLKEKFAGEQARITSNWGLPAGFNPELGKENKKPGEKVNVNLDYFRCIHGVDENVGKILNKLDALKLTENTVVVYSSDNGFYLGEHNLADKRSAYEESMRIPMLIRYPKLIPTGKQIRDPLVLNIDLAPTFLDLAGLPIPKDMQGKSWKPLLAPMPDVQLRFRDSFLYEYFYEPGGKKDVAKNQGGYNTPTLTAVRTEKAKLIRYRDHDDWTEVFDLVNDPYETKNLANDPQHAELKKQLLAEHARLLQETEYRLPKQVEAKKY